MNPVFKIPRLLLDDVHEDLSRPHAFAAERVGFMSCKVTELPDEQLAILAHRYHPVHDDHYEDDPSVGAMISGAAFREALQFAYRNRSCMFHIHRHEHRGRPGFSSIDEEEATRFVPDFWKVQPALPHGALVLSHDSIHGLCWTPRERAVVPFDRYVFVGFPATSIRGARYERP